MAQFTPEQRTALVDELSKTQKLVEAKEARLYRKSFWQFSKNIVGWPDLYEPLHKKVADFVQDNIDERMVLLLLPRGCFKSSLVTIGFPLWQIAKDPTSRGLIANATYPMATSFLGQVKKVVQQNKEFKRLYGNMAEKAPTWKEEAFSVNRDNAKNVDPSIDLTKAYTAKENTLTATGVQSNYTGTHYDYAILDDLVNRDNIRTKNRIDEVINFYKDVLDLVDPSPAGHKKIIVIGTTWHQADLYSWIQDPETGILGDFAVMKLPAFGHYNDRDRWEGEWGKGPLLFPTRLTWDVLEQQKRNQGSTHFSAQYLLNPVPPGEQTFKNFVYYDKENLSAAYMNKFIAVDPALTEDNDSDYSAMVCVGVDELNNWYILDLWRDKVQPDRLISKMFEWDREYKPITTALETTVFQRILDYSIREEEKRRGRKLPTTLVKHSKRTKEERIKALQPYYQRGDIYHPSAPRGSRLRKMERVLRDELERFPRGKNDDMADALASILEIARPPKSKNKRKIYGSPANYPA